MSAYTHTYCIKMYTCIHTLVMINYVYISLFHFGCSWESRRPSSVLAQSAQSFMQSHVGHRNFTSHDQPENRKHLAEPLNDLGVSKNHQKVPFLPERWKEMKRIHCIWGCPWVPYFPTNPLWWVNEKLQVFLVWCFGGDFEMVGFYLLGCEPQTYVSCIFLIMISSDDYVWDRFEAPGRFCRFGNFPWVCFPSKAISPRKSYALGGFVQMVDFCTPNRRLHRTKDEIFGDCPCSEQPCFTSCHCHGKCM